MVYRIYPRNRFAITKWQYRLSMLPRSDPRRPLCVYGTALGQVLRHRLSNPRDNLDNAIVNFTELILLPPLSWLQRRFDYPYSLLPSRFRTCIALKFIQTTRGCHLRN
jgi:hypothetical protein